MKQAHNDLNAMCSGKGNQDAVMGDPTGHKKRSQDESDAQVIHSVPGYKNYARDDDPVHVIRQLPTEVQLHITTYPQADQAWALNAYLNNLAVHLPMPERAKVLERPHAEQFNELKLRLVKMRQQQGSMTAVEDVEEMMKVY